MLSKKISKVIPSKEKVFELLNEAKEKSKKIGKDKVINSIIGSIYDEDEEFFSYKIVQKVFNKFKKNDIFPYASSVLGSTEYRNTIKNYVLGKELKNFKSNIEVIATPGGSGAIALTLKLYLDDNEKVLLSNYMWEAYYKFIQCANGVPTTFNMFKNNKFDLNDFKKSINEILKKQNKLIIIINDPCHNPTGYCMTDEEWGNIISFFKTINKNKKIILLNEIAYMDYDYRGYDKTRKHFSLFNNLPENILILISFSISKSFTSYGLRGGALIGISKNKKIGQNFIEYGGCICRSLWSSIPKVAMELVVKIFNTEKLYKKYNDEKNKITTLLKKRSDLFIEEAKKQNLNFLPYNSGFFITIPLKVNQIEKVVKNLKIQNVYVLPLKNGIRIAICSVPTKKIINLVKILKSVIC